MLNPFGHERVVEVFAQSFAAALGTIPPDLDEAGARNMVAEAEREGWDAAREWAVLALLGEAQAARTAREEEEHRVERAAKERTRQEREAKRAWKKLWGAAIAGRLKPWTNYRVLQAEGLTLAVPLDRLDAVTYAIRATGTHVEDTARSAAGVKLGTIIDAGRLDAADPSPAEAADLVAAVATRKRETHLARQHQATERAQRERQEREQVRAYGTTID